MNFSVLIPSRGRPIPLLDSILSLHNLARFETDLEFLVRLDDDDIDNYFELLSPQWGFLNITILSGPRGRGYPDLHVFVNDLAAVSTGKWLFLFNDDALMMTSGWDEIILNGEYSEVSVLKLSLTEPGNLFPVVSRRFYELLGHFSLSPHNDTWVERVSQATGTEHVVSGIEIHHNRDEFNDETHRQSQAAYGVTSPEFFGDKMQQLIAADVDKINEYLRAL